MQTNSSPQMRQPTNDDQMYMDKLRQLSRFIEPLKKMLARHENSEKYVAQQMSNNRTTNCNSFCLL